MLRPRATVIARARREHWVGKQGNCAVVHEAPTQCDRIVVQNIVGGSADAVRQTEGVVYLLLMLMPG